LYTFPPAVVTGTDLSESDCAPDVTYVLDGTPDELASVVAIAPLATSNSLTVTTADRTLARTHTLSVLTKHDGEEIVGADPLTLTLTIVDPCEAPTTLTKGDDESTTGTYMFYNSALTKVFSVATFTITDNSITECPFTYAMVIPPSVVSVLTFTPGTRTLVASYSGSDIAAEVVTLSMTVLSPAGVAFVDPGAATEFVLTLAANPCEGDKITVTASTLAVQSYTLGAAESTIEWPAFTYVTDPENETCALTYTAVTTNIALIAATTIDNVARTIKVSTSDSSMV